MFFVYCLKSIKTEKFHYYGYTSNLEKRLKAHFSNKVKTTKKFAPLFLLGYKEFSNREEALAFERKLKSSSYARNKFIKEVSVQNISSQQAFANGYDLLK